jgi:small subunit ribosomal protein S6
MYILRSDLGDELVDQSIEKYQKLLRDQGVQELETQHRGRRRLAYEINKQREGVYVQMNYTAAGNVVAVLEKTMRLSDEVIRFLTIKPEAIAAAVEATDEA